MATPAADGFHVFLKSRQQLLFCFGIQGACFKGFQSSTFIPLDSDVWEMDSPSFDLGSLSSSPFLYREGEDFLGQTVNTFFDEDISFDFVDTFEAGFSIAGRTDEVSATATHEKDQYLISESQVLLTSPRGHVDSDSEKESNVTDVAETLLFKRSEQVKVSQRENSPSQQTSRPENINTCTNEVDPRAETVLSRAVSKNAEQHKTQNARRQEATATDNSLSTSHDKGCVETGSQSEQIANITTPAALREDLGNNFKQNINFYGSVLEKTTFDNFKLLSLEEHTTCDKERAFEIKDQENIRVRDLKKAENNHSFGLKNSAYKRCVVPKTFYSPFWTPEKSTERQEKSLQDGFINARRHNVDILYCCHCKSQKRGAKNIRITMKPAHSTLTTSHKDSNTYIDFLKRNSVIKSPRTHRRAYNKTISGEISRHEHSCNNEANRDDKWISLPAVHTSFRTARQKALSNRDIGALYSRTLSFAPIDGLINKYKGRHFDLVKQQKRYQLKPFK